MDLCCGGSRQASMLGLRVLVSSLVWATIIEASLSWMLFFNSSMFLSMSNISCRTCADQSTNKSVSHRVPTCAQARREGGVGGKLPRAPQRLGAPASLSNTKIHQNAPFWTEKFQKFLPRGARRTCFEGSARMFPWTPLWLSTGLHVQQNLACDKNRVELSTVQLSINSGLAAPPLLVASRAMALPNPNWLTATLFCRMGDFVAHIGTLSVNNSNNTLPNLTHG